MREIKTVIVELEYPRDDCLRDCSDEYYGIGRELIRCKDCTHWDGYCCHNKWWGDGYGNYAQPIKAGDGFCDWAERKEE